MIDVEASRRFDHPAERVWNLVSDPERLAEWVPTAAQARPAGPERVHLQGESHGHPYNLDARLTADPSTRRLEWSDTNGSYRGWLQVVAAEDGSSVDLHIAIPEDRLAASDDQVAEIRHGIDETFDRLGSLLRG